MTLKNILFLNLILCVLHSCKNKSEPSTLTLKSEIVSTSKTDVQPFAQHIFSQFTNVRDFTMNQAEDEAYFTLLSPGRELSVIMKIEYQNGIWQDPKISSFSGKYTDLEPFLAPDNLRLYFASNRPIIKDSTNTKDFDIWYVERKKKSAKWSEPKNIGSPINTNDDEFYPTVAANNNLYFTSIKKERASEDDIFFSQFNNNSYSNPLPLSNSINTKGAEFNAFIAPDESYIIFSGWKRKDGVGSADLYISKKVDGEWGIAKNLGVDINSKYIEFCPYVSQKSQTLFFTSRRSNVNQKDQGFINTEELLLEINKYDNGSSRIYNIDFNTMYSQ